MRLAGGHMRAWRGAWEEREKERNLMRRSIAFLTQGAWFRSKARRESRVLRAAVSDIRALTPQTRLAGSELAAIRARHPGLEVPG